MINEYSLIAGNHSRIGAAEFNYALLFQSLLNTGLTIYQAEQEAKKRQREFEAEQARLAAAAAGGGNTGSKGIETYLPYILGGVILVLLIKK